MNKLFKNLTLRQKLLAVILSTTFFATLMCFVFAITNDISMMRDEFESKIKINAELIGEDCIPALAFGDYRRIQNDYLTRLENIPVIESAIVFDEKGSKAASYGAYPHNINPNELSNNRINWQGGNLTLFHELTRKGRKYGSIYLVSSEHAFTSRIWKIIAQYIILVLIISILSLFLANYFQKSISHPLLKLAHASKEIALGNEENIQLEHRQKDEIGQLYSNFNEMVATVKRQNLRYTQVLQKTAETRDRLDLILDSVSEGYWDWDVSSNAIYYSDKWLESLGYEKEDVETSPKFYTQLVHPEDLGLLKTAREVHFINNTKYYECEIRILRKDGTYRWTLDRGRVVDRDSTGKPLRVVGSNLDIDQRKETDDMRKKLEAQLRQAKKLETVGTIAGGISHDFKNILTPILGFTDLVMQSLPKDHEVQEDLKKILLSARRANELVNQILTFSRQTEAEKQVIQLSQIVEESIPLIKATIPSTIQVVYNLDDADKYILADATQMQQVIINLCTNAHHAMEETGGTLEITLNTLKVESFTTIDKAGLEKGAYVRLQVKDNGKGIPPKDLDHIFDPFFTSKEIGKGTGLGLSVVHGVIMRHRGIITIDSTVDVGTTLTIFIPVHDEKRIIKPSEKVSYKSTRGSEHLLIVDDEPINAFVLKRMLSNLGYNITYTSDPEEAVRWIKQDINQFDLIITDQTMPKITGLELANTAIKLRAKYPVIIITGSMELIHRKDEFTEVQDILIKPFEISDVNRAIRKVFD